MPRPTLDDIFAEPDEFGLLDVKAKAGSIRTFAEIGAIEREVVAFRNRQGRPPDSNKMRLADSIFVRWS